MTTYSGSELSVPFFQRRRVFAWTMALITGAAAMSGAEDSTVLVLFLFALLGAPDKKDGHDTKPVQT